MGENEAAAAPKKRSNLRGWLRATHRDLGYLAVGLTLVYAFSGLAVNHIKDWDPNFVEHTAVHALGPLQGDDDAIARAVVERLGIPGKPRDVYRESPVLMDITLDKRTLHVNPTTGHVVDEGQKPRFLLRIANWLHLNRGKKAWTYFADAYAVGLVVLAMTGLFMIPGRKGLIGRGAVFVAIGIAIPVAYVTLSGGP